MNNKTEKCKVFEDADIVRKKDNIDEQKNLKTLKIAANEIKKFRVR